MSDVNVAETRRLAGKVSDVFEAVYDDEGKLFACSDVSEQAALDEAFARGRAYYNPMSEDEAVLDVFSQFARLLPKLNLIQVHHDPNNAEFMWSRARMIFGAAGFKHHTHLAHILCALYPQCSMDPNEDYAEWTAAIVKAHQSCGWPLSMALAQWSDLAYAFNPVPKDAVPSQHVRVMALFHILKHCRYSHKYGVVVSYKNTYANFSFDESSSNLVSTSKHLHHLLAGLGAAGSGGKTVNPMFAAVSSWLRKLSTHDLIRRKPTNRLPGAVQHGPWSTLEPDPVHVEGFIQHGSRLTGVWVASAGKISPTTGDTCDIIGYDWPLNPLDYMTERIKFEYALPKTYDTSMSPFDVFLYGFPNINWSNAKDINALACLFDAIIVASLVRSEVPALSIEYPTVFCMPSVPSLEESTNQGKSKAAHTIARALVPGIPMTRTADTESAPDNRTLAGLIEQYGTLCVDEWVPPKKKSHLLSHENLQSLMTGGGVALGKAYDNAVPPVQLTHPIVASCKALDVPPDIINRSFVLLLDRLTDEQCARGDVLSEIESGKLSLRIRLAALGLAERLDIAARLTAAEAGRTVKGWRFNSLRALAGMIWEDRHGHSGLSRLDEAVANMQTFFTSHTREAEDNGLMASLEEGTNTKVRLYSIFSEMTAVELEQFGVIANARSGDPDKGWAPSHILRARSEQVGLGNKPLGLLCEHLCGVRGRVSDRSLTIALGRDVKAMMPAIGDKWALPELNGLSGWYLERIGDMGGVVRVALRRGFTGAKAKG